MEMLLKRDLLPTMMQKFLDVLAASSPLPSVVRGLMVLILDLRPNAF